VQRRHAGDRRVDARVHLEREHLDSSPVEGREAHGPGDVAVEPEAAQPGGRQHKPRTALRHGVETLAIICGEVLGADGEHHAVVPCDEHRAPRPELGDGALDRGLLEVAGKA